MGQSGQVLRRQARLSGLGKKSREPHNDTPYLPHLRVLHRIHRWLRGACAGSRLSGQTNTENAPQRLRDRRHVLEGLHQGVADLAMIRWKDDLRAVIDKAFELRAKVRGGQKKVDDLDTAPLFLNHLGKAFTENGI